MYLRQLTSPIFNSEVYGIYVAYEVIIVKNQKHAIDIDSKACFYYVNRRWLLQWPSAAHC